MKWTIDRHVQSAISLLESEIVKLENEGTRNGSLVDSETGGKYRQWHWYHDGRRKYISKQLLPTVKAEIERGEQVRSLKSKIDLLHAALRD